MNEQANRLSESTREVLLGVAKLMEVPLSGLNKVSAENALKNDSVMGQIKSTLEDEDKIKELSKAFSEKGMKNTEFKLASGADSIVKRYNNIAKENKLTYQLSDMAVDNLINLDKKLAKEREIQKSEIHLEDTKVEVKNTITIKETILLELRNDKIYDLGGVDLNSNGMLVFSSIINNIKRLNGNILDIFVEISTDSEPVFTSEEEYDSSGNISLLKARIKNIADLFNKLEGDVKVRYREIPNNGSDVVGSRKFKEASGNEEELSVLRLKTSDFRYTKLLMTVSFKNEIGAEAKAEETVRDYRGDLIKKFAALRVKNTNPFPNKKITCKSNKKNDITDFNCHTFKD